MVGRMFIAVKMDYFFSSNITFNTKSWRVKHFIALKTISNKIIIIRWSNKIYFTIAAGSIIDETN